MNRWLRLLLVNVAIVLNIFLIVALGILLAHGVARLTNSSVVGFLAAFAITAVMLMVPARLIPVVIVAIEAAAKKQRSPWNRPPRRRQ